MIGRKTSMTLAEIILLAASFVSIAVCIEGVRSSNRRRYARRTHGELSEENSWNGASDHPHGQPSPNDRRGEMGTEILSSVAGLLGRIDGMSHSDATDSEARDFAREYYRVLGRIIDELDDVTRREVLSILLSGLRSSGLIGHSTDEGGSGFRDLAELEAVTSRAIAVLDGLYVEKWVSDGASRVSARNMMSVVEPKGDANANIAETLKLSFASNKANEGGCA